MLALGRVIAGELQENMRLTRQAVIYARIMELPEDLLDILARDFNVGWYRDDFTPEVKRRVIHDCVKVHKRRGTKSAVETALQAVYPNTTISEWFEYGGEPFHFRVNLDVSGCSHDDIPGTDNIRRTIELYKRLSAWLDSIIYTQKQTFTATAHHAGILTIRTRETFSEIMSNAKSTDYHAGVLTTKTTEKFSDGTGIAERITAKVTDCHTGTLTTRTKEKFSNDY
jgi:phage tail P2-like protein